jgi:phosphonate transport system permease protein
MTSRLADVALADRAGLEARHGAVFRPPLRRRLGPALVVAALAGLLVFGFWRLEFSGERMLRGLSQLGTMAGLMLPPHPGSWERALLYVRALGETVAIAFLGTLLAAILAFPLGFLAARNATINRVVRFLARRFSDTIRGIDTLIWALIWVTVVGLGPFAGVLAVMTSDLGSFTKLFSEAIEAADRKAGEGVLSTGGSRLHVIRFGLLPQVLPVMLGQVLYFFESNTRSATIIGIVGAGGIGLHLSEQIRTLEWQAVSFIILLILVAVALIDALSTRLRLAIIGRAPA